MKKRSKRRRAKARNPTTQGKRNRKLLELVQRRKDGKKHKFQTPPSLMGDAPLKLERSPKSDKYCIRNVCAELVKIAGRLQNEGERVDPLQLDPSASDSIKRRMEAFAGFRDFHEDIERAQHELVIGFDLGSTCSKIVLRFPYEEGLGAYAIPAPKGLQSDDHPYYWTTQVWENDCGHFSLCPTKGSEKRNHLKVAFLNKTREQSVRPVIEEVYVSAYLALMTRQALGWLWKKLGRGLNGESVGLSANFGFPTESGGSSPQLERFEKCVDAALRVALSDAPICKVDLEQALEESSLSNRRESVPFLVVPEFIGAVMGYFHSAQKHNGQFMICDFGGLTLEAVCFGFLQRDDGSSLISIFGSAVKPFGAEVARIAVNEGIPAAKLTTAVGSFVCGPIKDSYEKTGFNAAAWGGGMPMFVIGGGRHFPEFKGTFLEAERLIKKAKWNTTFIKQDLDLDEELDVSLAKGRSCGRLMVAFGLSHPDLDLPDWAVRSEIRDAPKQKRRDIRDSYVGKEQV